MTIKISTEDLAHVQEAAEKSGTCLFKTKTEDGEPVWISVEAEQRRRPRRIRAEGPAPEAPHEVAPEAQSKSA